MRPLKAIMSSCYSRLECTGMPRNQPPKPTRRHGQADKWTAVVRGRTYENRCDKCGETTSSDFTTETIQPCNEPTMLDKLYHDNTSHQLDGNTSATLQRQEAHHALAFTVLSIQFSIGIFIRRLLDIIQFPIARESIVTLMHAFRSVRKGRAACRKATITLMQGGSGSIG